MWISKFCCSKEGWIERIYFLTHTWSLLVVFSSLLVKNPDFPLIDVVRFAPLLYSQIAKLKIFQLWKRETSFISSHKLHSLHVSCKIQWKYDCFIGVILKSTYMMATIETSNGQPSEEWLLSLLFLSLILLLFFFFFLGVHPQLPIAHFKLANKLRPMLNQSIPNDKQI